MTIDTLDHDLIEDIAAKSEQAMQALFEKYSAAVFAFAVRRLPSEADAADVLNDVMLSVWRGAAQFQGRSKVKTWLLGITHHKVVDKLRKKASSDCDELNDNIEDESVTACFDVIANSQDADAVRRCMEKLTDAHRQVVHLAFFEDLSYPEISGIIEKPPGTVKTRMMHAKQNIKKCLQRLELKVNRT